MMKFINKTAVHIVILIVVTAGFYASSLGGEFVYDDKAMILAYDLIKDIGNLPKAFYSATSVYGNVNYYRPLQTASYMIDYFLWGNFPSGFHFTNVLMHLLCVLSVYWLIKILFKDGSLALLTALIFAVHPVHSTVVAYIAGRADSMLCFFTVLCFVFYLKFKYASGNIAWLILSVAAFIMGLLCKELAMIIPVAIILFDKYGYRFTEVKPPQNRAYSVVPFFAAGGIYFMFRVMEMSFFVEGAARPFPFKNRIITVPYVLAQYLRLAVFPNDLHMGRAPWVALGVFDEKIIVSTLVVCAVLFAAYKLKNRAKPVWFGFLWFLLLIFPSLNIITPLFYTIAENWLYLPSIGLFLVLAYLLLRLYRYGKNSGDNILKFTAVIGSLLFVLVMGVTTHWHNLTWKDEIALGENTLKYNPREFKVYNNIGVAYLGKGDLDMAESSFRKCLEIKPDTGMAYFNLYRVYMARGQRPEAVGYLNEARRLDPHRVGILVEKMGIRD